MILSLLSAIHRWHSWSLSWLIYIRSHLVCNLESAPKLNSIYILNPCLKTTVVLGLVNLSIQTHQYIPAKKKQLENYMGYSDGLVVYIRKHLWLSKINKHLSFTGCYSYTWSLWRRSSSQRWKTLGWWPDTRGIRLWILFYTYKYDSFTDLDLQSQFIYSLSSTQLYPHFSPI